MLDGNRTPATKRRDIGLFAHRVGSMRSGNTSQRQTLSGHISTLSGIILELSRRNSSLFVLKCLLFQTGNPFRC
jgi:hypothetical protein